MLFIKDYPAGLCFIFTELNSISVSYNYNDYGYSMLKKLVCISTFVLHTVV